MFFRAVDVDYIPYKFDVWIKENYLLEILGEDHLTFFENFISLCTKKVRCLFMMHLNALLDVPNIFIKT